MLPSDLLEKIFRLDKKHKRALQKLKLFFAEDLLFYFPSRYSYISVVRKINQLIKNEQATIYGRLLNIEMKSGYYNKKASTYGDVSDETGTIKIIWFNQAYISKMLHEGQLVELTGIIMSGKYGLYMANPEFKKIHHMPVDKFNSLFSRSISDEKNFGFPIYPETKGITSKWFYHAIKKIIQAKTLDNLVDYIPQEILKKYNLPSLKSALIWMHLPKNENEAKIANKRFAFDEIFCIQLERQHDKYQLQREKAFKILVDKKAVNDFIKKFSFTLTNSQKKVTDVILNDLERDFPASRLLEGDVGSGKTIVAAIATFAVINHLGNKHLGNKRLRENKESENLQVAYMAPTEILAFQHFESFIQYFSNNFSNTKNQINVGLITGSGCKKFPSKINKEKWTDISRTQLLKMTESGEISMLIGTHAIIGKKVKFNKLGLVIIDEQHRFGITQRWKLVHKDKIMPHFLSMTATPMPRTLSLTIYGDLDLSLIDEMPIGRKQIITEIVMPHKRDEAYEKIKIELKKGRQLFVICPRIFEPDQSKEITLNIKSAVLEAKRLQDKVFPEYKVDIMHSRLTKIRKEKVMRDFADGKTNILCSTSVVEVGVNVPNATIIIIEGAERFGLAQLHQLRGRVWRSSYQAYCYIFADIKSEKTLQRLKAIQTAKNGFELAEMDLLLRGSGELSGERQWGITDLGMEAIKNQKMVEAARAEAIILIKKDPELINYPLLKEKVRQKAGEFHFE